MGLIAIAARAGRPLGGEAPDVFTAFTADRMYSTLRELGWTFDRCEEWVSATAKRLLLGRA